MRTPFHIYEPVITLANYLRWRNSG